MGSSAIIIEKRDGVATITLNRPEVLNAINTELAEELLEALQDAARDESVRAVILTGAGRAFSSGGDIREISGWTSPTEVRRNIVAGGGIAMAIANLPKPVIAAVNGVAAGAGCNVALAADIVIAADTALFAEIFVRVGLVLDFGGSYLLPRRVGLAKAKELAFTGRMVDAAEAERIGLVNQVVPADQLQETAWKLARQLADGPTVAIGLAKKILNESLENDLQSMIDREGYAQAIAFQTEDHREGIRAFKEKREPEFKGK